MRRFIFRYRKLLSWLFPAFMFFFIPNNWLWILVSLAAWYKLDNWEEY